MRKHTSVCAVILTFLLICTLASAQDGKPKQELRGKVTRAPENAGVGDTITIDLGKAQNLRKGMEGVVYYELRVDAQVTHIRIGTIRLTTVRESQSEAIILQTSKQIEKDHLVSFDLDIARGVGVLQVISHPTGAQVLLDGKDVGKTELVLNEAESGVHTIRVQMPFYTPVEKTITIEPNDITKVEVSLQRSAGSILVVSEPSGAEVLVGKEKGRTPATFKDLPAGEYSVRVELDGYYPWEQMVTIKADETIRVSAELEKHAVLVVDVIPDGTVSVDGNREQASPARFPAIPLGEHAITARLPDYEPKTVDVTVQAGRKKTISIELQRARVTLSIASTPSGAEVTLDGRKYGNTPITIKDIVTGEHTFSLSLQDYETVKQTITVNSPPKPVRVTLAHERGSVVIKSSPDGATLYVDGKAQKKKTPVSLDLLTGEYTLKLEKEIYRPISRTIQLHKGQNRAIIIPLEAQEATLSITSTPGGSGLRIDGRLRSEITPAELSLPPGEYVITLEHEDYEKHEQHVILKDQENRKLEVSLKRETQLSVTSEPSGITVDLGTLGKRQTPDMLRDIKSGDYEAKVSGLKGYRSMAQPFTIRPHERNSLNLRVPRKSRFRMAGYSLIMPGAGQFYGGRKGSGTLFLLAGLGAAGATVVGHLGYGSSVDEYDSAVAAYNGAFAPDEIESAREAMIDAHDDADSMFTLRRIALISTGAVWGLNALHALIVGPAGAPEPSRTQVALQEWEIIPEILPQRTVVTLQHRF